MPSTINQTSGENYIRVYTPDAYSVENHGLTIIYKMYFSLLCIDCICLKMCLLNFYCDSYNGHLVIKC